MSTEENGHFPYQRARPLASYDLWVAAAMQLTVMIGINEAYIAETATGATDIISQLGPETPSWFLAIAWAAEGVSKAIYPISDAVPVTVWRFVLFTGMLLTVAAASARLSEMLVLPMLERLLGWGGEESE